jgi:hypothetical protein
LEFWEILDRNEKWNMGETIKILVDGVLTTQPSAERLMTGISSRMPSQTPMTFTSMIWRSSATDCCDSGTGICSTLALLNAK